MSMLKRLLAVLLALALALGGFVCWNISENQSFEETFYTLESDRLNSDLRVAVIADLHQLSFGENNGMLIQRVSKLRPDLIVVAGDLVDKDDFDPGYALRLCEALQAIAPVYYGLGNHENIYVYGKDLGVRFLRRTLPDQMNGAADFSSLEQNTFLRDLEALGVQVVQNRVVTAEINGETLEIGGVSTDEGGFWDFSGSFVWNWAHNDSGRFKLLICHRPNVVMKYIPGYPFDLVLAGHLHGGGMRIPGIGGVWGAEKGLFPDYTEGLYRRGDMTMIVSRGFAGKGLLPRILNKPELVIVDVVHAR